MGISGCENLDFWTCWIWMAPLPAQRGNLDLDSWMPGTWKSRFLDFLDLDVANFAGMHLVGFGLVQYLPESI